jgi:dihydroorotate dehydrogenase
MDGADAYARIRAGASLVQVYTGLIYGGPALASRTLRELEVLLRRDGFATPAEAVGADHTSSGFAVGTPSAGGTRKGSGA